MGRYESEDEQQEAEDRIARIRGGGSQQSEPSTGGSSRAGGDPFGDADSEALSRARSRGRGIRTEGVEASSGSRATSRGSMGDAEPAERRRDTGGGPNPIVIIGGVVGAGLIVVLLIVLASFFFNPNAANPFVIATETPTPTLTPTPTNTPEPTPTNTPEPPDLEVPNLECIFNPNVGGCFDYCEEPENADQCQGARDFVNAQGADPEVFFECLAPNPGANVGNAQECLDEAWLANQ